MSSVTLSFNLSAIPVIYQSTFLERVCQLNLEYQSLTASLPVAPSAESLPKPNFVAVDGDESAPVAVPATKKERKSSWSNLTEEQRKERLAKLAAGREAKKARKMSEDSLERAAPPVAVAVAAAAKTLEEMEANDLREILGGLMGVPADSPQFRDYKKFPNKQALIAEIRHLREAAADGVAPSPSEDAASETSSKKQRKNPWADLTPEQKAERVAKTVAARKAKKEAAATAPEEGSA
jgi:hypothetical protein